MPVIDFGGISMPGTSSMSPMQSPNVQPRDPESPAVLRETLLSNPHDLALLKERNPPLAEALLSGSLGNYY